MTARPPHGPPDDDVRGDRIRAALERLRETVLEIGAAVEAKRGERCPYRTATDACTFRGGCRNKVRRPGDDPACGGDHLLKWHDDKEPGTAPDAAPCDTGGTQ